MSFMRKEVSLQCRIVGTCGCRRGMSLRWRKQEL